MKKVSEPFKELNFERKGRQEIPNKIDIEELV
jgi:hypothetical protein